MEFNPFTAEQIEEFNHAWRQFFVGKNDAYVRNIFKLMDRDGNGKISRKELKQSMTSCIGMVSDEEINQMLQEADTNGDGHLQYEELLEILKRQRDK